VDNPFKNISTMKCTGIHALSAEPVEVRFDSNGIISGVDPIVDVHSAGGIYIAPGFIDLQVNGFAGVDYNITTSTHEQILHSLRAQFATGVTRLLPTLITNSEAEFTGCLRNLANAKESLGAEGAAMEGFHVEGPFISAEDGPRGAHPVRWARKPDFDEYKRWQEAARGQVKLVTVSPEYDESPAFIEAVVRDGVVVSIGHTKANTQQIANCVAAGATMSTHLGNGAHSVLPRHPNYIWDQLAEDRLTASLIVDGIHLGANFLKVAIRAKTVERTVLVTDAVMPAGCEPGDYQLGEVEVELKPDNRVVLRGGTRLAGSALSMHDAVSNIMAFTGVSLRDAVTMATINAARAGRIGSRHRGLNVGDRADLVRFTLENGRLSVLDTWLSGRCVYSRD
jgi:N-acetylglucosamine-6-phosphate deacetylase